MAAHPQRDEPETMAVKNPFPTQMTVPGPAGDDVVVDLAVVAGTLYAPNLDDYQLDPDVRQYVTSYCSVWSGSVLTADKLERQEQERPRRAQIAFDETQLHAMLGLASDERLLRIVYEEGSGRLRFLVESPRLPQQPYWNGDPMFITLPVAAHYEKPVL